MIARGLILLAVAPLALLGPAPATGTEAPARVLRVCADPNNLPFSNERREGFENRLAELLARELRAEVRYTWWAQHRGFFRSTLNAGLCDLVPGMPSSLDRAWATRPYYRSSYVFVTRRDRHLRLRSFDDPALRSLRIGVQLVGDDYANTPPAHALARRGLAGQVVGYRVLDDYRRPNPPAHIMDAVVDGSVDVAVVWGPLAGWFAGRSSVPLDLVPVRPQVDLPFMPFVFDIAMGVRRADTALHAEIDAVLLRRRAEIGRLLAEYGVPRVDARALREAEGEGP